MCVHVCSCVAACVTGYVCVGRGLGRENAVACDCNTTAMGSCCTVMHNLYHGLCVSVLGVWEGGVAMYTCVHAWCKEHQNGLTRVCTYMCIWPVLNRGEVRLLIIKQLLIKCYRLFSLHMYVCMWTCEN